MVRVLGALLAFLVAVCILIMDDVTALVCLGPIVLVCSLYAIRPRLLYALLPWFSQEEGERLILPRTPVSIVSTLLVVVWGLYFWLAGRALFKYGPVRHFPHFDVHRGYGASWQDVQNLGNYLQKTGYATTSQEPTGVLLQHWQGQQNRYVVEFTVEDEAWDNPATVQWAWLMGAKIAMNTFQSAPTTVFLCDQFFESKKQFTLTFLKELDYAKDGYLLYTDSVTDAEASRVGQALAAQPVHSMVTLCRDKNRLVLSYMVPAGAWDDAKLRSDLAERSRKVSQEAFSGAPLEVHLCDQDLKSRATLKSNLAGS